MINQIPFLLGSEIEQLGSAMITSEIWIGGVQVNLSGGSGLGPIPEAKIDHIPLARGIRNGGVDVPFPFVMNDRRILDRNEMVVFVRSGFNQRARGNPS